MDNTASLDISNVISTLMQNPTALSALGSIMQSIGQRTDTAEQKSSQDMLSALGSIAESVGQKTQQPAPQKAQLDSILGLLSPASEHKETPSEKTSHSPLGSKEEIKNRIALLNAVKPFLCKERQEKLLLIIKLLRLSELGELANLLGKLS